ncbi:MAG: EamA family transporter [Anaerolineae bacterium]|nr:EamA family transporter [Anaerolineae bacterium]
MSSKNVGLSILALVIANSFWGAAFAVAKFALQYAGPFVVLSLRFLLALAIMLPFTRQQGFRFSLLLKPRLLILGLTGITLSYGLGNSGLKYTTSGNAVLIFACAPVVTAALSSLLLKEKLSARMVIGIALSLAGAFIAVGIRQTDNSPMLLGNALLALSMIAHSFYVVLTKRASNAHSAEILTAVSFAGGVLCMIPLTIAEALWIEPPVFHLNGALAIVYLAAFPSALAFYLWNYGLRHINASVAGVFMNLMPVVGLVVAFFIKEPIGILQMIGGGIIIIGVWMCASQSS